MLTNTPPFFSLTFIGMLIYAVIVYRREKRNPAMNQENKMDFVHNPHLG